MSVRAKPLSRMIDSVVIDLVSVSNPTSQNSFCIIRHVNLGVLHVVVVIAAAEPRHGPGIGQSLLLLLLMKVFSLDGLLLS